MVKYPILLGNLVTAAKEFYILFQSLTRTTYNSCLPLPPTASEVSKFKNDNSTMAVLSRILDLTGLDLLLMKKTTKKIIQPKVTAIKTSQ